MIRPTWMQDALCQEVDPELFDQEDLKSSKMAKSICRKCDVLEDCTSYALLQLPRDDRLIYAGMTWRERTKIRSKGRVA